MRNSTSKLSLSLAFCGSLLLVTNAQASVSKEEGSSTQSSITSTQNDSEKKETETKSPSQGQSSTKPKSTTKTTAHMFITSLVNAVNQTNSVITNNQSTSTPKTNQTSSTFVSTSAAPQPAPNQTPSAPATPAPAAERVETFTIQGTLMELQNGEMVLRVQSNPKASAKPSLNQLVSAVHAYQLVRIETLSTQKLSSETMVSLAERVFETVRVTYQVKGDSPKFVIDVR